jgi:hypothetical protein
MLPASKNIELRQKLKAMRTAVEKAEVVQKARNSVHRRPRASGQVERLERVVQGDCAASTGAAWERAEGGRWPRHCASTPWLRRSTLDSMAQERAEGGRWQRLCASTPQLRHSTLAGITWERAEGGRWQRLCASTPRSRRSTFTAMLWERTEGGAGRDTAPQHHAHVARTQRE